MKNKTRLVLIIIFLSLLTITTYPTWKKYLPLMETKQNNYQISETLNQLNSIKEIRINQATKSISLIQGDNQEWLLNGQNPSNQENVQELITAIQSLSVEQIVSNNQKNLDKFGIKKEDGTFSIEITDSDGHTAKFLIGKNGLDYNTFYLKEENDPSVYLVTGTLNTFVKNDTTFYQSKTIAKINPESINKINIAEVTLIKTEGAWKKTINGGQETELSDNQISTLNNTLSNFKAQSVLSEAKIKRFNEKSADEIITIEFFSNGQSQLKLNAVERKNGWWIEKPVSEEKSNYYLLSMKDIQALKGEEITVNQNSAPNGVPNTNGNNMPFVPMQ